MLITTQFHANASVLPLRTQHIDAVPKENNDLFWMLICKVKASEWLKACYSTLLTTTENRFNSRVQNISCWREQLLCSKTCQCPSALDWLSACFSDWCLFTIDLDLYDFPNISLGLSLWPVVYSTPSVVSGIENRAAGPQISVTSRHL